MRAPYVIALIISLLVGTPAFAQANLDDLPPPDGAAGNPASDKPSNRCYDVAVPVASTDMSEPILIDHCSGKTWVLVRAEPPNMKGKPTNDYIYEWSPIAVSRYQSILRGRGVPNFSSP